MNVLQLRMEISNATNIEAYQLTDRYASIVLCFLPCIIFNDAMQENILVEIHLPTRMTIQWNKVRQYVNLC